jgi:hypothetical protein
MIVYYHLGCMMFMYAFALKPLEIRQLLPESQGRTGDSDTAVPREGFSGKG